MFHGIHGRVHKSQDICCLLVSLTSTMSKICLQGNMASLCMFLETNIIIARDIGTLSALCFHSQPRGGPELLGAPLLRVRALWSMLEYRSEQVGVLQGAWMESYRARFAAGSDGPQTRVGAGRILVRATKRSVKGAIFDAGSQSNVRVG